jgi:hypothetical protein
MKFFSSLPKFNFSLRKNIKIFKEFSILNLRPAYHKRFTSSIPPPSGCGKGTCGCKTNSTSGNTQSNNLQEDDQTKILEELKRINYKIIQCINLGHFQEAIDTSDKYISEVEKSFGKQHIFYCSAINNKAFILKVGT